MIGLIDTDSKIPNLALMKGRNYMKVKDLVEECKNRPTKKDCEVCPFTEKCNFLKGVLSEMSPSEYETLMDKNI